MNQTVELSVRMPYKIAIYGQFIGRKGYRTGLRDLNWPTMGQSSKLKALYNIHGGGSSGPRIITSLSTVTTLQ